MLKSLGLKKEKRKHGEVLTDRQALKEEYFMEPTVEEADEVTRILAAENHFKVLEVSEDKDYDFDNVHQQELKDSYLSKCLVLNPNQCNHPRLEEAFKKLSQAYDTLSDPVLRRKYRHEIFGEPDPAVLEEMDALQRALEGEQFGGFGFPLIPGGFNFGPMTVPSGGTRIFFRDGDGMRILSAGARPRRGLETRGGFSMGELLLRSMLHDNNADDDFTPTLSLPLVSTNRTSMRDDVEAEDRRNRRRTIVATEFPREHERSAPSRQSRTAVSENQEEEQERGNNARIHEDDGSDMEPGSSLETLIRSAFGDVQPSRERQQQQNEVSPLDVLLGSLLGSRRQREQRVVQAVPPPQQRERRVIPTERPRQQRERRVEPRLQQTGPVVSRRDGRDLTPQAATDDLFASQRQTLRSMGFDNDALNKRALEMTDGNVEEAVALLI